MVFKTGVKKPTFNQVYIAVVLSTMEIFDESYFLGWFDNVIVSGGRHKTFI